MNNYKRNIFKVYNYNNNNSNNNSHEQSLLKSLHFSSRQLPILGGRELRQLLFTGHFTEPSFLFSSPTSQLAEPPLHMVAAAKLALNFLEVAVVRSVMGMMRNSNENSLFIILASRQFVLLCFVLFNLQLLFKLIKSCPTSIDACFW